MGKKSGETTQAATVQIPPEVLARYNAVNARAEDIASQPFTPYGGDFVAPINSTQQAGISNINQAQSIPYQYYDAAGQAMNYGYQSASPYYGAATESLYNGQNNANQLNSSALQNFDTSYNSAQPYQQQAYQNFANAESNYAPYENAAYRNMGQAQGAADYYQNGAEQGIDTALSSSRPYQGASTAALNSAYTGAQGYQDYASQGYQNALQNAQPYQQAWQQGVGNAYNGAQGYANTAYQGFNDAYSGAQAYQGAATQGAQNALAASRPYQDYASQGYQQSLSASQPYQQAASNGLAGALSYAEPYQNQSRDTLMNAYGSAQPYQQQSAAGVSDALNVASPYQTAATQDIRSAYSNARPYQQQSVGSVANALSSADPYQQESAGSIRSAYANAQPFQRQSASGVSNALNAAAPYQASATQGIDAAYNNARPYQQQSASGVYNALNSASPLQSDAMQGINSAYGQAQPFQQRATGSVDAALSAVQPYIANATRGFNSALGAAQPMNDAANQNVYSALARSQPFQANANQNINSAFNTAQGYQQDATSGVQNALASAVPYNQSSEDQLRTALSGAKGYENVAKALGLSGADAVAPTDLNSAAIDKYMSPYQQNVVNATMKNLREQQQQEQSQLLGNQIMSGAFGGDRGRIAQANLARQQDIASGTTLAGLMNQGYGQALTTAQQQQAQQLAADQANRTARAQTGAAMAALGQQGFGQGLSAAQQFAALGQQNYGQGLGAAQQLAAIGNQGFTQGATLAQQQAALGQQEFGQGMAASQQLGNLGNQAFNQASTSAQNMANLGNMAFGQGMNAAQQYAAIGNQGFNQGAQRAQQLAALGQQNYAQNLGAAQQMAALGQQEFGQGATRAQQLAALGQQDYAQNMGAAQQMAALGQQEFGQGSALSQQLASLGQQNYAQNMGAAQQLGNLGQQEFGQGATLAQQMAAIGNQGFNQNLSAAQQMAALGQQNYAQGANTAQQLSAIGQQGFNNQLSVAQQNAALGQQAYQQGTNTADRMAALGQQNYGQESGIAQLMASIGQQGYQQGTGTAQQIANLGNQNFNQGLAAAQQYGAMGQQGYQQGMNTAQQMAALGQQNFNQGLSASQQYGNIGQQNYAQNLGAAQQRAALGQQAFGQGMSLANQNAALGQQRYNMANTTGQQLTALGNQMYNQGMGVGDRQAQMAQQMFGQGTAGAQALQGLGQGIYNQAQTYGQGIAGLGTQAFENALKGGQAQITAGTLQQQTQQAQNQADYNQFLQQQGYPFQTTQFLGNLAMGTGALSGQNTGATTSAPVPWMSSDRRLKDNIEPVGKTFDGQNIYRFNYKNEPTTRLGLIAQEVEKHTPEAVGLAGGYRVVDYAKATEGAADRGHFASGGYAAGGSPDFESILAEILGNNAGKHPYGGAGLYGDKSKKSGPYNTTIETPRYSLPPPPRMIPPAQQPSGNQQLNELMQTGRNIGSVYNLGKETADGGNMLGRLLGFGGGDKSPVKGPDLAPSTTPRNFDATPLKGSNFDAPLKAATDAGKAANPSGTTHLATPISYEGGLGTNLTSDIASITPEVTTSAGLGAADASPMGVEGGTMAADATPVAMEGGTMAAESGLGAAGSAAGAEAAAAGTEMAAAEAAPEAATFFMELLSMFSDKRLKENVRPVGKTFDGQTVYTFNYKGEKKTQMGLIAQEVQKHHPEAVGLAAGYKTVNYHDATNAAAKRGHFNIGGGAIDPSKAPGMNEGLGGSMPYGGSSTELPFDTADSIVPDYTTKNKSPTDLQNQQKKLAEPSSQIKQSGGGDNSGAQAAQIAMTIAMMAMMASDRRLKENVRKIGKTFDGQNIYSFNYKGEPTTQIGLIAQEVEKYKPEAVGSINGYKGVNYKQATNAAAKRGHFNRGGYEDGGAPVIIDGQAEEVNPQKEIFERAMKAIRRVESGGQEDPYRAMGTPTRTGDRAHGAYQIMGANIPSWSREALGRELTPQEFLADNDAQDQIARHRMGKIFSQYGNPQDLASVWFSGRPVAEAAGRKDANGTTVPEYLRRVNSQLGVDPATGIPAAGANNTAGLSPNSGDVLNMSGRQYLGDIQANAAPTERAREREQRSGVKFDAVRTPEQRDWMQRNQDWLIPILTGLGSMAGSQSRMFLPALMQGVAGGAQTYANMQNRGEEQQIRRGELEVQQENSRTSALREETAQQQAALQVLEAFDRKYRRVQGPDGRPMFIDQTGGSPLTQEQHARQRANLFQSLMSGRRGASALSDAQAPMPATGGTVAPQGGGQPAPEQAPQQQPAAPTTAQPAAPATGTPTQQQPADTERQAALAALQPYQDEVARIEERMRQGRASGFEPSEQDMRLLADAKKHLNDLRSGREPIVLPDGQRVEYFVRQQAEAGSRGQDIVRRQEAVNEAVKKTREEAQTYLTQTYPETNELLGNMSNLRQLVATNRGSQVIASLAGYGAQIPWLGEWVARNGGALQAAVDANNKEAVQQAFSTLAESAATRAPATGLREALMTVANSDVSPGAAYMMITNTRGRNDQQRAYYEAWLQAGQPDPLAFSQRWQRENPLHNFVQQAVDQTPYFAGMNEEQRRILPIMRSDDPIRQERERAESPDQARQQAVSAFGAYEPDKYEYGINPQTGRFARRPIGGGQ